MEENLKLSKYLELCLSFEENPSEENQNALQEFLTKLQIKEYMPITDKMVIMVNILSGISSEFNETGSAAFLEVGRVVKGLLGYCINLENDIEILTILYAVYDKIRTHGLYQAVLSHCEEDFNLFSTMLRDAVNIAHIQQLSTTAELFDGAAYDNWVKTMEEMKNYLTPDILTALAAFNNQNSPEATELLKNLAEKGVAADLKEFNDALVGVQEDQKQNITEEEPEEKTDEKLLEEVEKEFNEVAEE